MENDIISVLNLKNGVGCSCLAWNIAHTLQLNLYQHDKAIHHLYNKKRKEALEAFTDSMLSFMIETHPIEKKSFHKGVYDLGSDFNYAHTKKIIAKSKVIIIPCELGHETLIKTIATLRLVFELNEEASIFVVINKLLPLGKTNREKKYTQEVEGLIEEYLVREVKFYYVRNSFVLFRNLDLGFFFLDNYLIDVDIRERNGIKSTIKPFELLQHARWKILHTMKENEKKDEEIKQSSFYAKHQQHFEDFIKTQPMEDVIDGSFLYKNKRAIKDMLILTTRIKKIIGR